VITCWWKSNNPNYKDVKQSTAVAILRVELESEPNNDMVHADKCLFNNVFIGQLFSPYDEDWYKFTITSPSRVSINFITTAIPADAGCAAGTTTTGTWKVDIRDSNNETLMSYRNIDCIHDNGIWETGVMLPGTYYVVVYCPRLGTGNYYLDDPYYLAVMNSFNSPCGESDQLVNAASMTLEGSVYQLNVPMIDMSPTDPYIPYFGVDFQYDPVPATGLMMFRLTNIGQPENFFRSCNMSTLLHKVDWKLAEWNLDDNNYVLHIPVVIFDGVSYRAELTQVPSPDGQLWFKVTGVWFN
jgi:hypothetical protein